MPKAWNNWYHVTVHAYGSWLRGDPRGWRSLNHREHVEGDYNNPPPKGKYSKEYARSLELMTRPPVRIEDDLRRRVIDAVVEKLEADAVEVIVVCLDAKHLHVLAKFNDHRPKHWTGRAKKHSSHVLRQEGLRTATGGIWAKGCHQDPIVDRKHQIKAFNYIQSHAKRGAVVWNFSYRQKPADSNPQASCHAQSAAQPL